MKNKEILTFILTILFSVVYLILGHRAATINEIKYTTDVNIGNPQRAVVTKIIDDSYEKVVYEGIETEDKLILFEARFTTGYRKGDKVVAIQTIDSMYAIKPRQVTTGDNIIIHLNQIKDAPEAQYMFAEYYRVNFIIWLGVAFCVLLLVLGRINGVKTLVSLAFTVLSIFYVFIPAVLNGGNIYLWAISTCIYIIFMTLLIISGFSRKSLAAMIGCASGVVVAGILTLIATRICHLTGLTSEDAMYLMLLNPDKPVDLTGVIFAAIILGAVGAIMDVSMSLSSALAEIKHQAGHMTGRQITRSGMVVGRDIMGTMANTLILAYIGSSLSVTLLLVAYNHSTLLLFNTEMILVELLQALAGSLGILLTIPLTSVICGILYESDKTEDTTETIE